MTPQTHRKEPHLSKYPDIVLEIDRGLDVVVNDLPEYTDFIEVPESSKEIEPLELSTAIGHVAQLGFKGLGACLVCTGHVIGMCLRTFCECVRVLSVELSNRRRQQKHKRPRHVQRAPRVNVQNNITVSDSGAVVNVQTNINVT